MTGWREAASSHWGLQGAGCYLDGVATPLHLETKKQSLEGWHGVGSTLLVPAKQRLQWGGSWSLAQGESCCQA